MSSGTSRPNTALILPLVLLTAALAEEIAWTYLRSEIRHVVPRVVVRMVLVGVVYSVAAEMIEPRLREVFTTARTATRRRVGRRFGPWPFYAIAYGLLFAAYYVLETRGTRAFLP